MSTRRQAELIFHRVVESPESNRAGLLRELCAGSAELEAEVASLLAADEDSASLAPVERRGASAQSLPTETRVSPTHFEDAPGGHVGPYRLLQRIGEGGFGTVWVAEQREPVRRKVALKIVKPGMDSKDVLARFAAERQALAMMDHPSVAKVYDAGVTARGLPYFVMEHVPGLPITEYCDTGKLRIHDRLELFMSVCHAVQHAHTKGIIHRDLKPSNILVTLHDGKPALKVIDFGIAKATIGQLTDRTLYTEMGRLMGTPEYMSPEQAGTTGLDVDTRADVYSLGVILYQLLTGTLPFDAKTLRGAGLDGMARIIREMEPPRPSTRLTTLSEERVTRSNGESPEEIGKAHGVGFAELRRELSGDLDWIVMKCLEKDRSRRYETASGLATDIERHLNNEPVLARPPSRSYRLRKFVRRNRVLVASGSVVVLALVLGIAGTSIGLGWALRERDKTKAAEEMATDRAAEAEAVTEFLTNMLSAADPSESGRDVLVRQVLDKASSTIDSSLRSSPTVEARVHATIGKTYASLGLFKDAEPHLSRALEIRKECLGEDDADTILSMNAMAALYWREGRTDDAKAMNKAAVERGRQVLGERNPRTLAAMHLEGVLAQGEKRYEDALAIHQRVLETRRRVLGNQHADTLISMNAVGNDLSDLDRHAEAARIFAEALELQRRTFGEEHPTTLLLTSNLAMQNDELGRKARTLPEKEQHLATCRRVLGDENPATLGAATSVYTAYMGAARFDEAAKLAEQVLAARRRSLGDENKVTISAMSRLGNCYRLVRRGQEAVGLLERVVELRKKIDGEGSERVRTAIEDLAWTYADVGRCDDLRRVARDKLAMQRRMAEAETASAQQVNSYAWSLLEIIPVDLRDPAAALPVARRACQLGRSTDPTHPATYLDTLAVALLRTSDVAGALQATEEALSLLQPGDGNGREVWGRLVGLYGEAGREADARAAFLRYREQLKAWVQSNPKNLDSAFDPYYSALLFAPFDDLNDPAEALRFVERALSVFDPGDTSQEPFVLAARGVVLDRNGRTEEAVRDIERVIDQLPEDNPDRLDNMRRLAEMYAKLGRMGEAREWTGRQLATFRGIPEDELITYELNAYAAALLLAVPEDLRDPARALPIARRAVERAEKCGLPWLWNHLDTLAMAQHATGDIPAAVQTEQRALSLAPFQTAQRKEMEGRLAAFKAALAEKSASGG